MKLWQIIIGFFVSLLSLVALAALPTDAAAAFTALFGNVTDILAAIWPIVIALVSGFALIKFFKNAVYNLLRESD